MKVKEIGQAEERQVAEDVDGDGDEQLFFDFVLRGEHQAADDLRVRRDVVSRSADDSVCAAAVATMTDPSSSETARATEARKLRELIVALDRRESPVQPAGEVVTARTGEELRDAALRRLD